jgi:type II secretory pathway pseudopilin PulG
MANRWLVGAVVVLGLAVAVLGSLLAVSSRSRDESLRTYCQALAQNVNGAVTDINGYPLPPNDGFTGEDLRRGKLFVAKEAPTPRLRTAWRLVAETYIALPHGMPALDATEQAMTDTFKSVKTDCGISRFQYETQSAH